MTGPGTELTVGAVTRHYARVAPGKCALYDGDDALRPMLVRAPDRSEEHTSELQSPS